MRAARTQAPGCAGRAPWTDPRLAASDDSIFYCSWQKTAQSTLLSRRSSHDGTIEAEYRLEGYGLSVSERGGLLFCVIWVVDGADDGTTDEIIALDAQTLELRHRFGLGLFDGAQQLAVVGDELYVCDIWNDRLQVFSLTGEHRRSITGEWRLPRRLCCAKDRLYLVEGGQDSISVQGHWILVLSLLRATSCRSSRTQRRPRSCSDRSAASMASCWRATVRFCADTTQTGGTIGCLRCEDSDQAGDQGKPGEPGHRSIGRRSCRSALADGVVRRSTAVVLG